MLGSDSSRLVVLLASVLKPVDDTRMRGKFAETLLQRPYTQVHVAGRGALGLNDAGTDNLRGVFRHPIFSGSRLSLGRLTAQWRYWRLLQNVQPDIVVVHAPELLPVTMAWQGLGRGRKFLYDIRENYVLNISTQQVYRDVVRRALAAGLRWVETQAARRAAGLLLAEASYAHELPFLHELPTERIVVLENKYQPGPAETLPTQARWSVPAPTEALQLLFSGTISELNGVWEAIALTEQLYLAWPGGARLTIIGFCQQPALLRAVHAKAVAHSEWLTLVGGNELVPHEQIVAAIGRSHLGLLAYRPHTSTARCRPTKLFEYLAHGLPILATPNPLWQELLQKYGAGLSFNFSLPIDAPALVVYLQQHTFYPQGVPDAVLWAEEGKKLWHLLDSLI